MKVPETVIVIGAGIVGVSTAFELALRGVRVTLLEEREGAGLGTSYANGAQLSACEVAPWPGPETPLMVLRWLGRTDAPFRMKPKLDPEQWLWLFRFLLRCRASARAERIPPNLELALLTRARLAAYEEEFERAGKPLDYERLNKGILRIYHEKDALNSAVKESELFARLGLEQQILTPSECTQIEPALGSAMQSGDFVGGLYAASDSTGDAYLFSHGIAEGAERLGVTYMRNTRVRRIISERGHARGVETDAGTIEADAVVVAAGVETRRLLSPFRVRTYVYPLKGYSVTVPAPDGNAPEVSVTDEMRKVVVSRLGNRIRSAGQVEVGGYDLTMEPARARSVLKAMEGVYPQMTPLRDQAEFWCGLRPMTPDGSPVIGAVPGTTNVYVNSGHGTLGWTLGAGSGAALASLICDSAPQMDLTPFSISRF
ncbi:MAG: D-amino acid dehydrogenase [Parvibaculum sp.]